jgi:hypothetical protein
MAQYKANYCITFNDIIPVETQRTKQFLHEQTELNTLLGLMILTAPSMGGDSSVSIVAHYRLDGLGIKLLWGQDIPHLSRLAMGPTQPPVQ